MIICTSPFLREDRKTREVAKELYLALDNLGISHLELKNTRDYWCRDYMPVSLFDDGGYAKYEYKPDYLYEKKPFHQYITKQNDVLTNLRISTLSNMGIVFDGGNYVRAAGKVVMTDKIFMENSQWPLQLLVERLHRSLMADIVLLPWDMDDPYGHADGMVAPLPDGRLLLNNYAQTAKRKKKNFYKLLKKILVPHFDLVELSYDCKLECNSWCYLNFLKVPGAVLLPCLEKNAECDNDQAALDTFQRLFPNDKVIPIYARPLIEKGGALHCVTWEYYMVNDKLELPISLEK